MLKAALKILKEAFAPAAASPSPEKRLYDAFRAIEQTRPHLKKIAPVTEAADLRLACASGLVESWSFDDYVGIRLAHKGWIANDVIAMAKQFRDAAKQGRLAFALLAEKTAGQKPAQFLLSRAGDAEAVAAELKAMTPADMAAVPRSRFLA